MLVPLGLRSQVIVYPRGIFQLKRLSIKKRRNGNMYNGRIKSVEISVSIVLDIIMLRARGL